MVRAVLAVTIVALILMCSREANAQYREECLRENEVWDGCGTACPLTCENPELRPCIRRCEPACRCIHGFLRRWDGACVRREDCYL